MLAFEPLTVAMGMALAEHAVRRPARVCCYAKLWLRRAPDVLVENALNEVADSFLDVLNKADTVVLPGLFFAIIFVAALKRQNLV
jgi:hypothetical protein